MQVCSFAIAASMTSLPLPLMQAQVVAGFPSPAEDFIEGDLDLNQLVIRHPSATFFIRVIGESMQEAGIFSGDMLVVDRAAAVLHGDVVLAVLDGEFTVKRWVRGRDGRFALRAAHPDYPDILLSEERDFEVWGVVTYVFRSLR